MISPTATDIPIMVTPDGNNLASLKAFFAANPYLQTSELAILANRSMESIRKWRRRCGIPQPPRQPSFRVKKWESPVKFLPDQTVWDNREWFHDQYYNKERGVRQLRRMTGKNVPFILRRFKKFGITMRPGSRNFSKNPCCTKEWLEENFMINGLDVKRCARKAGVNNYTIVRWLSRFGFLPREMAESQAGERNPNFGKTIPHLCK